MITRSGSQPMRDREGTNYWPTLTIAQWVDRPADLPSVRVGAADNGRDLTAERRSALLFAKIVHCDQVIRQLDVDSCISQIREHDIGLFVVDQFIEAHTPNVPMRKPGAADCLLRGSVTSFCASTSSLKSVLR